MTRPAYGRPGRPGHPDRHDHQGRGDADQGVRGDGQGACPRKQDPERYFLGYFTGEGLADGEQLRFGALHRQQRARLGRARRRPAVARLAARRSGPARPVHHPLARRRHLLHDRHGPELVQPQPRLPDQRHAVHRGLRVPRPRQLVAAAPREGRAGQRRQRVRARGLLGRLDRRLRRVLGAGDVAATRSTAPSPGNQQMWYTTTRDFRTFAPARGVAEPGAAVAHRHHGDQGRRLVLPLHQERGRQRGSDMFSEKHTQPARHQHRQLDPGRPGRSGRRARGWPTRATRARWCSRPTRATPPARSSSTSGRTATRTAAATSCRAAPNIEAPKWDGQDAAVHQHRRPVRARHGHAARAARVEPHPGHREPGRGDHDRAVRARAGDQGGRHRSPPPCAPADGYEIGGRVRFSVARLGADRLPRRTAWPRSPCPGNLARRCRQPSRPSTSGHDYPDRRRRTASRSPCCRPALRRRRAGRRHRPGDAVALARRSGVLRCVRRRAWRGTTRASTTATVTSTAGDAALSASTRHAGQRRVPARAAGHDHAGEDRVERAGRATTCSDRVQAVDRRDRAAADRHLQRERHVHAVDHDAVTAGITSARASCARGRATRAPKARDNSGFGGGLDECFMSPSSWVRKRRKRAPAPWARADGQGRFGPAHN